MKLEDFAKELNEGFSDFVMDNKNKFNPIEKAKNLINTAKSNISNITSDIGLQRDLSKFLFGKGIIGNIAGTTEAKNLGGFANYLTGNYNQYLKNKTEQEKKEQQTNKNTSIWDKLDTVKSENEIKTQSNKAISDLLKTTDPLLKKELSNIITTQWKEYKKQNTVKPEIQQQTEVQNTNNTVNTNTTPDTNTIPDNTANTNVETKSDNAVNINTTPNTGSQIITPNTKLQPGQYITYNKNNDFKVDKIVGNKVVLRNSKNPNAFMTRTLDDLNKKNASITVKNINAEYNFDIQTFKLLLEKLF